MKRCGRHELVGRSSQNVKLWRWGVPLVNWTRCQRQTSSGELTVLRRGYAKDTFLPN